MHFLARQIFLSRPVPEPQMSQRRLFGFSMFFAQQLTLHWGEVLRVQEVLSSSSLVRSWKWPQPWKDLNLD